MMQGNLPNPGREKLAFSIAQDFAMLRTYFQLVLQILFRHFVYELRILTETVEYGSDVLCQRMELIWKIMGRRLIVTGAYSCDNPEQPVSSLVRPLTLEVPVTIDLQLSPFGVYPVRE